MPSKTVVFTGLSKFGRTGSASGDFRWLSNSEFRQMAGRSGRRGLDTVGNVVVLPNLTQIPPIRVMEELLTGRIPSISSRFVLNYIYTLRSLSAGPADETGPVRSAGSAKPFDLCSFLNKSLYQSELNDQMTCLKEEIRELELWTEKLDRSNFDKYKQYSQDTGNGVVSISGLLNIKMSQGDSKQQRKRIGQFESDTNLMAGYKEYKSLVEPKLDRLEKLKSDHVVLVADPLLEDSRRILKILKQYEYVTETGSEHLLTVKGVLATRVNHCQELLLVEMLWRGLFDGLAPAEVAGLLALFSDMKTEKAGPVPISLREKVKAAQEIAAELENAELRAGLTINSDWSLCPELVCSAFLWVSGATLSETLKKSGTFAGNLIRELVRLSHVAEELSDLCRIAQRLELLQTVEKIPELILRDIVTIESLYLK